MKKSSMKSLVAYLNGETITNLDEIKNELVAELAKDEEKAQANRNLYATAKTIVLNKLTDEPITVAELFEKCRSELPEGFSKSKVQYALTRYWQDEVVKVDNGRNPFTYKRA